jgi:hypothetical protein
MTDRQNAGPINCGILITMIPPFPSGSAPASPVTGPITELPLHVPAGFNDASLHPGRISGTESPLPFRLPPLSSGDAIRANSRSVVLPSLVDLGLHVYMRSWTGSTSTVAFEPVTRQSSAAGTKRTRESSEPDDSITGGGKRRRIEYPVENGDASSQALRRCIDEGQDVAERRRQALESIGAGRPCLNASAENDVSLYIKLRQLFDVGQSGEERRETLHQINRLLGTGASLPQESRRDPVLNERLAQSIKVADVPLATLLWRVGTGSSNPSRGAFHRDGALATLFLSDGDVSNQLMLAAMLVETGCPVDGARTDGSTGLIIAAQRNNFVAVQWLLNAGANVNLANMRGRTALLLAAVAGNSVVVKLLLDAQADVNGRDHLGITALVAAVWAGHEPTVRLLLNANADVHLKYSDGETILNCAVQRGNLTVVGWLQDVGAEMTGAPHPHSSV